MPVSSDTNTRPSRLDSPPPLPPSLSDKKAPDLAKLAGTPSGTPPTGELMKIVLEHAQLAEQIDTSLAHMLPGMVPVIAQIAASRRLGVVSALKGMQANPQQSLAQGAGPVQPPQPMEQQPPPGQPPGQPPSGPAAMPAPPPGAPPMPGG